MTGTAESAEGSTPLAEATNPPRLARDLSASVGDGVAYGVMVGIGETYVAAFMLAVSLGEVFTGLVSSVPLLAGSALQMLSPWAIQRLGSHRRWVVYSAGLQGLCFVPLLMAAWQGSIAPWWAMTVASVYWGAGLATGPAWNTWQGTIIPRAIRTNFFARRSRWQQIATLAGFLIGGFSLDAGRRSQDVRFLMGVFAAMFIIAGVCRGFSTFCLAMQSEPIPIPKDIRWLSLREQLSRFTSGSTGRLLLFAVAMQAGVYISGPYFNPYILKVLQFTYSEYAMLLGASFVAKFLCLPLWGQFAHRFGAQKLLWAGAIGIIPLAMGWNLSSNFYWLTVLQLLAGTAWGAYELALVLLFFETIPEEERTSVLTLYNFANSAALVLGSMGGALILKWGEVAPIAYNCTFTASTIVRVAAVWLLWRASRRDALRSAANVSFQPMTCQPNMGSLDQATIVADEDSSPTVETPASEAAPPLSVN